MIVFNEKLFAEKILIEGFSKNKFVYKECLIIARYLRHNLNKEYIFTVDMSDKQIRATQSIVDIELANKLNKFCVKHYPSFNIIQYANAIENIIKYSKTKELREMKNVIITKKEIDSIHAIEDFRYRKFLFVLLVLCKYFHAEGKGYYCNFTINDMVKIANVTFSRAEKDSLLNKLYNLDFINPTYKKSIEILFVDEDLESPTLLEFVPDDNLILNYEKYAGEYVTACIKCGTLFRYTEKQKRSKPKYCKKCKATINVKPPIECVCVTCSKKFLVDGNYKTDKCKECYKKYRADYNKKFVMTSQPTGNKQSVEN